MITVFTDLPVSLRECAMIRIACPQCKKGFHVKEENAGRKTNCPSCTKEFLIPFANVVTTNDGSKPSYSTDSTQPPSAGNEGAEIGQATKIVLVVCVAIFVPVLLYFIWFISIRDTWELDHSVSLTARLDEADKLRRPDPLGAYKIYDEVLRQAHDHTLRDEQFLNRLANAETSRMSLNRTVRDKLQEAEASKQRQLDEEAQRAAAENQPVAQAEERNERASTPASLGGSSMRIGETYTLNVACFGAVSEATLDKCAEIAESRDDAALQQLSIEGQITPLESGTRVTVEDATYFTRKAKVRPRGTSHSVWIYNVWVGAQ